MTTPHILILGGTFEARRLAEKLASHAKVTLSLAGRTAAPLKQAGHVRTGGFGGASGLATYLRDNAVDILVDATHPFAARISANAALAARETNIPLIVLERPAWEKIAGDHWIEAKDVRESVTLLGATPRNVFLAIGRQELLPFRAAPQHHYIIRSVDPVPPDLALPNAQFILDRGPFDADAEKALFAAHRINILVAKNSGGDATYGKIAAARALKVPVAMIRRPGIRHPDSVSTCDEALARIRHVVAFSENRGE